MSDTFTHHRPAGTHHPLLGAIEGRWSPRAFSDAPLPATALLPCFEAASWAPSAFNLQPWSYVCGMRGDATHAVLAASLMPFNAEWAVRAGALVAAFAHVRKVDGAANAHALYDLGQSVAMFSLQAFEQGLHVHQMAGFDAEALTATFGGETGAVAVTLFAVGKVAPPDILSEKNAKREIAPRERRPLDQIVRGADPAFGAE